MDNLERLAKPYIFKGKRHSVRTLHTALQKAAKIRGSLSFDKDGAYLRPYDGSAVLHFLRAFNQDGDSVIVEHATGEGGQ